MRSLWQACVDAPDDARAWESFLGDYLPLISGIAARVAFRWGASPVEVEDVIQEVCLKISGLARQRRFTAEAPAEIEAYLKSVAANTASDYFRSRHRTRRSESATVTLEGREEILVSAVGAGSIEHTVFLEEIGRLLEGDDREQKIFWLYYRQGLSAKEIAAIPALRLSAKGVESALLRMVNRLREKIHAPREGYSGQGAS